MSGEMTPHHRDKLLHCVLQVARDADEHVRASAISNLGEICRLLRFSLGPVIHEVYKRRGAAEYIPVMIMLAFAGV